MTTGKRLSGKRWWAGLAAAAALGLALVGCVSLDAEPSLSAAERIEDAVAGEDVPVAVPTELPDGYRFADSAGINRRGDRAVASAWLYAVEGERDAPPVHVCVLAPGADESACPASPGPNPIERQAGRYRVLVDSASQQGPDASAWQGVDFTPDWRGADWIDDPSVF